MAEKKRMIEIIMSGQMSPKFQSALNKTQAGLNRYRLMLNGVDKDQNRARNSCGLMGSGMLKSAIGFAAAYVGTQQLVAGIRDVNQAYSESVREETRLEQLMGNVRGTTKAQIAMIKRYAGALQNKTTIEDESTLRGASQLATFQFQAKSIKNLLPSLQDLAVGTYGVNVSQDQMQQSANLLGKVFTGNVGALSRVGITFTKTQAKMLKHGNEAQRVATLTKVISQNYGGLARQMAQTPEGRIIQLNNAWGNIKETIGGKLAPVVTRVLWYISDNLPKIQALIMRSIGMIEKAAGALKPVWDAVVGIGRFMIQNWKIVVPILSAIAAGYLAMQTRMLYLSAVTMALTAKQWLLNLAMGANPVGAVCIAIGVLIGLIVALVLNWDKVKAAMSRAWKWFVKFGTEGVGKYIPIVRIIALVAKNWNKIIAAIKKAWGWLKKFADKASKLNVGYQLGKFIGNKIAGKRALGGPVSSGRSYLVGERGPELFTPRGSGGIIPNNRLAAAGGITINFSPNITVGNGGGDINGALDLSVRKLESMIKRIMADEHRRSF